MSKIKIKFISLLILIILIMVIISGCFSNSRTVNKRRKIWDLSLSSDGSKLISTTDPYISGGNYGTDFQIWNTENGEIIWEEYPSEKCNADFIANTNHFLFYYCSEPEFQTKEAPGIYNISDGKKVFDDLPHALYLDFLSVGNIMIIGYNSNYKMPIINTNNFSIIKTIDYYNGKLSPNGSKLVFFNQKTNFTISVMNVLSENNTYVWNQTFENIDKADSLQWSKDNKIGFRYHNLTDKSTYLMILDGEKGSKILDKKISYSELFVLSPDCKKYIINTEGSIANGNMIFSNKFELHNLTSFIKEIELGSESESYGAVFDWSYDGNIIAVGKEDGIIWITDANTGEKLKELKTPVREITS